MSNPNEEIPPKEEHSSDNLVKSMASSNDVQWITEPAPRDASTTPEMFMEETKVEASKTEEQTTPTVEEPEYSTTLKHLDEPTSSSSKPVDEIEKKLRATDLSDEEDEYVKNPPQTEKDDNGFMFYKCRFCGLTFNFMTTLKAHERSHGVDTPYLCPKCNESFHFMCELELHAKSHEKQKGYKCECGRTFFQYTDLLYHTHPGEDPLPPPIEPMPVPRVRAFSRLPIEPSEFPTPEYAEKGFEPKHPLRVYSEIRSKPYICQYCSKSYSDSRQLAYHMYSHRGERMFNPRASRYLMCRNENSYISPGADVKSPFV